MTAVEVCFRYGVAPADAAMRGIHKLCEVYGIRRISFDNQEQTVRVEYDATRLNEATVAGLLRRAGVQVEEKLALV
jgi:copper chaperone CopZ